MLRLCTILERMQLIIVSLGAIVGLNYVKKRIPHHIIIAVLSHTLGNRLI
jgi:hypothetical protein